MNVQKKLYKKLLLIKNGFIFFLNSNQLELQSQSNIKPIVDCMVDTHTGLYLLASCTDQFHNNEPYKGSHNNISWAFSLAPTVTDNNQVMVPDYNYRKHYMNCSMMGRAWL